MSAPDRVILIHAQARPKPLQGAPCNGCGVCCLLEPCPLGIVLSGKRQGACGALRWMDSERQYRCGALAAPLDVLRQALPHRLRRLAPVLAPLLGWLARRSIAVGQGCDSSVQAQPAGVEVANSPTMQPPPQP